MATAFTKVGKEKLYSYFGIPKGTAVDDAERIINADPAKKMQYARFKSFANQMAKRQNFLYGGDVSKVIKKRGEYAVRIDKAAKAEAEALGVALPSMASRGNRISVRDSAKKFEADLAAARAAQAPPRPAPPPAAPIATPPAAPIATPPAAPIATPPAAPIATPPASAPTPAPVYTPSATIEGATQKRMDTPALPTGTAQTATKIDVQDDQFVEEGTGQLDDREQLDASQATAGQVDAPKDMTVSTIDPTLIGDSLPEADAAQGEMDPRSVIEGQEQDTTKVSDLEAAQIDKPQTVQDAPTRTLEEGELIDGSAVDQSKVEEVFGSGEVQAASVQDEMGKLLSQFEDGGNPVWAAGGMRRANQILAARGLSASSMAGQAIIQAMMEAALPIAQIDASNKQQMNMMKAEQRAKFLQIDFDQAFQAKVMNATKVSEIANMNFNAQQQIALENARMAQTVDLANLSNRQALVMAEAAQISQLEMASLSNRQQAEVINAQNFLALDMKNLDNRQQTELFNTQNRVQAMFSDQAADNAAKQFNASSQNQLDQFFASLQTQVQQFNASQQTAISQFNAGQTNSMAQFNDTMDNQRDQFNAQNQMVIAQNNVQWRRAIATGDTAAINRANELNANAMLGMSNQAYQNLWQYFGDTAERTWKSAESQQDRITQLAMTQLQADASISAADKERQASNSSAIGGWIAKLFGL